MTNARYAEDYAALRAPVAARKLRAPVLVEPHRFDPSYGTDDAFGEPARCVCGRPVDDRLHRGRPDMAEKYCKLPSQGGQ